MKKGFFFSIVSLVLLIYIFSSLTYKAESIRQQSLNYKESIRLSSYELLYSQLSENNIKDYLEVVGRYALLKMADHTSSNPIIPGGGDGLDNVRTVFTSLFFEGDSPPQLFEGKRNIIYTADEKSSKTFVGLRDKFNSSLRENGLILKKFDATITNLNMQSPYEVLVEGTIDIEVLDAYGKSSYSYSKPFSFTIDIEGYPDPLVNRYLKSSSLDSYERYIFKPKDNPNGNLPKDYPRSIYKGTYEFPDAEKKASGILGGRGWFYGKVVEYNEINSVPQSKKKFYILAGKKDVIESQTDFGAYIYTDGGFTTTDEIDNFLNSITHDKPFLLYPDFKKSTFYNYKQAVDPEGNVAILFINEKEGLNGGSYGGKSIIYKIEYLRDAVICSYYFNPSSLSTDTIINPFTSEEGSPSFLQRMLSDGYKRADPQNGLFSFLVGREFGGDLSSSQSLNSKLDFEFVGQYFGDSVGKRNSIRGLPACKSKDMCSINDVSITYVPEIIISDQNLNTMWSSSSSMQRISCNWGASCE